MSEFQPFPKIARLAREMIITEKLDGTNAQVYIRPAPDDNADSHPFEIGVDIQVDCEGKSHYMRAGSRSRWLDLTSKGDNFGFAKWVHAHAHELALLGPGRHFGEWFGQGIQRGYGLDVKRFALFNVGRWVQHDKDPGLKKLRAPECCHVVPVLYWGGNFDTATINWAMETLARNGSEAAPGFMDPEGIIVFHTASSTLYKKTFEKDAGKEAAA